MTDSFLGESTCITNLCDHLFYILGYRNNHLFYILGYRNRLSSPINDCKDCLILNRNSFKDTIAKTLFRPFRTILMVVLILGLPAHDAVFNLF